MNLSAPRLIRKTLPAVATLSLASLPLGGCGNLAVQAVVAAKGNLLSVRDSTEITVTATTFRPFATLTYKAVARRGRIVQRLESDSTFTYFAPYTSRFPDAAGNPTTGDTIQIYISDGFQTIETNQTIQLSGNSVVFKGPSSNCADDGLSDCNGPLYAATVDESGIAVRDVKQLKDSLNRAITGTQPCVSPDGRKIAWVVWPGSDNTGFPKPVGATALYTMDAGGIVQQITSTGYNVDPSWSPFGNELVFSSFRGDAKSYDIWRISTEQANLPATPITTNGVDERYPAWNPNPQFRNTLAVAVHAQTSTSLPTTPDADLPWNVMTFEMGKGGTTYKEVTDLSVKGDFAIEPRWRTDGQWLAYTYHGSQISTAKRPTRIHYKSTTVAKSPGQPLSLNDDETTAESNPNWSPAGNEIAYLRYQFDANKAPLSPIQVFKGTPVLSQTGTNPGIPPQQWSFPTEVLAFRMLSSSFTPVGGWGFDWR